MARLLQLSLVILEDVDLIAGDRSFGPIGANPLLFEVLNQIDGLGDDVDVTFLLTTNRVDILERALAERPGRVDTAVEIGLPDAAGRARLLRLYGAGLGVADMTDDDLALTVAATEGRTASYLREVVRRAAIAAAEARDDGPLIVEASALAAAANELLEGSEALTRALLVS
jgi:cell division protease FtsH